MIRRLSQWLTPQTQAEMDSLKKTDMMPYGSNMCFTLHLEKLINSRFYEDQTYIFYPLNSPGLRVLLIHAFLALLKQADGLLGLLG